MKKIKSIINTHSLYLLILTGIELIVSIVSTLAFVYSDSLSYNDSLVYNALGVEKLLETLYSSTFWGLILLILAFIVIFNVTSMVYKKKEYSFISLCLWFLMLILSINLTKPIMDNLMTLLLFVPIIIINIIARKKEEEKLKEEI